MLPSVLTHSCLSEIDIFVDPETGSVTGIVDWAEARILPFGFGGFENILGHMSYKGWHYYDNRAELEGVFWETVLAETGGGPSEGELQLIRTERMAGLLCRYGFVWNDKAPKTGGDQV